MGFREGQEVDTLHKGPLASTVACRLLCIGRAGDLICGNKMQKGQGVHCMFCPFISVSPIDQTPQGDNIFNWDLLSQQGWTLAQ